MNHVYGGTVAIYNIHNRCRQLSTQYNQCNFVHHADRGTFLFENLACIGDVGSWHGTKILLRMFYKCAMLVVLVLWLVGQEDTFCSLVASSFPTAVGHGQPHQIQCENNQGSRTSNGEQ